MALRSSRPVSDRVAGRAAVKLGRNLPRKFFVRGNLLWRWLTLIVLPGYWKPLVGAMILLTAGSLAEAASFVVAAQLFINWSSVQSEMPALAGSPLLFGGGALLVLLLAGAFAAYAGFRIAVRTVLDFETLSFAHAIGIARDLRRREIKLSDIEQKELLASAPRFMGRTVLQCVGLGTSLILAVVGAIVCSVTFPVLALILSGILIVSSPIFIYTTMYSTNVGHRMRESATRYSKARKQITAKWVAEERFQPAFMKADVVGQTDYGDFLQAFGDRMMISPLSRLVVNATLAVCILASLMWMTATLTLNTETVTKLVIFLVFLRLFFSGARSIITAVQVIASFVPNFRIFLTLDPRMNANPPPPAG